MNNFVNNHPFVYDDDWDSDQSLWHTKVKGQRIEIPEAAPSFYNIANPEFEIIMAALNNENVDPALAEFARQWGPRPFTWYTPSDVGGPLNVGYALGGDSDDDEVDDGQFDEDCYEYERYMKTLVGEPLGFWIWVKNKPRWWTTVDLYLYEPTVIEDDYGDY